MDIFQAGKFHTLERTQMIKKVELIWMTSCPSIVLLWSSCAWINIVCCYCCLFTVTKQFWMKGAPTSVNVPADAVAIVLWHSNVSGILWGLKKNSYFLNYLMTFIIINQLAHNNDGIFTHVYSIRDTGEVTLIISLLWQKHP